jgi:hypothetical protein
MAAIQAKTALHELILARLLVTSARGLTRGELVKSLRPFGDHRFGDAAWAEAIDNAVRDVEESGALTRKPLQLTPPGEREALAMFGLADKPARLTWRTVKSRYLPARALGLVREGTAAPPADANRLRALLLAQAHGLDFDGAPTLNQVAHSLAWQKIGAPGDRKFTLKAVLAHLLLGRDDPSGLKDTAKVMQQVTARAIGARNNSSDELYKAVLRRWVAPDAPPPAAAPSGPTEAFNLAGFAEAVREAARTTATGRFGANKVFISHVWHTLQQSAALRGMDEGEFKRRLAEANGAGLLRLSRADLVEAMNPDDVRQSETRHLNATFHFVQLTEGTNHGD